MKYNLDCPHSLWTAPMTVSSDIKVLHICYLGFIFCYHTRSIYLYTHTHTLKMFKSFFAFQLYQKEAELPSLPFLSHSLCVLHQLTIPT